MNLVNILISAASGLCGTGVGVAIIQGIFGRHGTRAQTAKTESDTWREESELAFDRLKGQCDKCEKALVEAAKTHAADMRAIRTELGDVKDALITRVDVVDEMLLAQQQNKPLSEGRLTELRAENRAVKFAIIRART